MLHRLINNKWFGEFRTLKRSSWLSIQYWKWCFLNIWCLIDVLLFPVLFVLFYTIHICRDKARKKRGNLLQRVFFIHRLLISPVWLLNSWFSTYPFEMILGINNGKILKTVKISREFADIFSRTPPNSGIYLKNIKIKKDMSGISRKFTKPIQS